VLSAYVVCVCVCVCVCEHCIYVVCEHCVYVIFNFIIKKSRASMLSPLYLCALNIYQVHILARLSFLLFLACGGYIFTPADAHIRRTSGADIPYD
jgi:hypothetical protein